MARTLCNPFSSKHPVEPKFFVNRVEALEGFGRSLAYSLAAKPPKPDNVAIVGKWGVGKTSVLKKFEEIAAENPKVFTAIVELTPASCIDFYEFSRKTRDEIERSFRVSNASLLAKLKNELIPAWRIKTIEFGLGIGVERKPVERALITIFEDSLRELWKTLSSHGVELAILMFDDLHYLAERHPDGLYDLRGVFQKLAMDGYNYMLVITGPKTLFQVKEFAEPFSRFFDHYELGLFNESETRKAITQPLALAKVKVSVNESVIEKIHALTAGHPYFIHFMMQDLVDLRGEGVIDARFFAENYPSITTHLARDKFDYDFLSKASEGERKVLLEIAGAKSCVVAASQIKARSARRFLRTLAENGLVNQLSRGKYELYHPLFKEYLRSVKIGKKE